MIESLIVPFALSPLDGWWSDKTDRPVAADYESKIILFPVLSNVVVNAVSDLRHNYAPAGYLLLHRVIAKVSNSWMTLQDFSTTAEERSRLRATKVRILFRAHHITAQPVISGHDKPTLVPGSQVLMLRMRKDIPIALLGTSSWIGLVS